MKVRFGLLAAGAVLMTVAACAQAAVEKAVYYDATQTQGWMGADARDLIHDYFVGKGYTDLDATGVKTWMDARIKDHSPSVIVMSQDIFPTTIVELNTDGTAAAAITTLRQYLDAGGKIVQMADWPIYNVSQDGTNVNLAGGGASAVLGFAASDIGDAKDADGNPVVATITEDGKKWGLTQPWVSQRALTATKADVVLASIQDGVGAAGWLKRFALMPTSGYVRLWDTTMNNANVNDDVLADIQRVAEYGMDQVTGIGTLTGTVTDQSGAVVPDVQVKVTASFGSATVTTDAAGKFVVTSSAGDVKVTATGKTVTSSPTMDAAVKANASVDVALKITTVPPYSYKIIKAKAPITLDGTISDAEWADADTMVLDKASQYSGGAYAGPDFLSGTFRVKFDDQYLYVAADINDQTPRINVHTDGSVWQGDGIEVYVGLDAYDKKRTAYDETRNFQWSVGAGPTPAWKIFRPTAGDKLPPDIPDTDGNLVIKDHAAGQKPGYVVEMRMPWSGFPDADPTLVPPKEGTPAAITAAINDNNDPTIDTARQFGMLFEPTTEAWHDPSTWVRAEWGGTVTPPVKLTVADATRALRIVVGLITPTATDLTNYDRNSNGKIEIADVTKILRIAIGLS